MKDIYELFGKMDGLREAYKLLSEYRDKPETTDAEVKLLNEINDKIHDMVMDTIRKMR